MERIIKVDEPAINFITICSPCKKQMLLYSSEDVFGTDDKGEDLSMYFVNLKCPECDKVIWILQN
jgi:uncharacterized protein with PIN domain